MNKMTDENLINELLKFAGEPVDYAEMVGSPVPSSYGVCFTYEEPEQRLMAEAAFRLTSLRAAVAEKERLYQLQKSNAITICEKLDKAMQAIKIAASGRCCSICANICPKSEEASTCSAFVWRDGQEC